MIRKFYRVLFSLTGDDRRAFESITGNAEAIERIAAIGTKVWRERLRHVTSDHLTCRHLFTMRVLLAAARVCVRDPQSPEVLVALALFLTDLVEQRVRTLDLKEAREGAGISAALSAGTFVNVRKVSASDNPMVEAGAWGRWVMGSPHNTGSLPVSYSLEGVLLKPLQVGAAIHVLRVKRNGVVALGEFTSTTVMAIHPGNLVETANSIYIVRPTEIASALNGEER